MGIWPGLYKKCENAIHEVQESKIEDSHYQFSSCMHATTPELLNGFS
jgi:hypothetical protein